MVGNVLKNRLAKKAFDEPVSTLIVRVVKLLIVGVSSLLNGAASIVRTSGARKA